MAEVKSPSRAVRIASILWPSFLMAGVLEMLVFAVIDPTSLQWFGGDPITWPPAAVYTVTFLLFWLVLSTSGALTQTLLTLPDPTQERPGPAL